MDRTYICKNKHYFKVESEQLYVSCIHCAALYNTDNVDYIRPKIYMINELEAYNVKTSKFKTDEQLQVLPAVNK